MASPAADLIVLATLGKLYAHGHELNGYCRACRHYFGHADAGGDCGARRRQPNRRNAAAHLRGLRRARDGDPRHGGAQMARVAIATVAS
jgi:hypothetical protein